ncbi:MAG: helix-turn-helix domain-containing protein [Eubacteriales bacterium]
MFSDKLNELRKTHKISQSQLARIFKLTAGTVCNWEAGRRHPDFTMLLKISDYFNVSTDYLLGKTEWNNIPGDEGIDINKSQFDAYKAPGDLTELTEADIEDVKMLIKYMNKLRNKNVKKLIKNKSLH